MDRSSVPSRERMEVDDMIELSSDFPNLLSMLAGFTGLVVEGDNVNVMRAISSPTPNFSLLGNVVEDVQCLVRGLQWVSVKCVRRSGNKVAHTLARQPC